MKTFALLKLIKKRASTRKFNNKRIGRNKLLTILEAGIWGPSLASRQPGKFVIVRNVNKKRLVVNIVKQKLAKLGLSGRAVFTPSTISALENAQVLIAVYNTKVFSSIIRRFAKYENKLSFSKHIRIAEQAEISAVSAAIQNMILVAESLGIGTCWLHLPIYCEKEINKVLGCTKKLVAVLVLGYAKEKGKRSPRKLQAETTVFED